MQTNKPGTTDKARVQETAGRVTQEHEANCLTRAEQIAFVSAVLNPPLPNKRLRQAAAAYRKQTEW